MNNENMLAIVAVVAIGGSVLAYEMFKGKTTTTTTKTTKQPTTAQGVATGNWLTSVGVNWYGPNYYIMPNGQSLYFSSSSSLVSYAKQQGYLKTIVGPSTTDLEGSYSNPYSFTQGYLGAGWYLLTSSDYSKLKAIPASGITMNPFYTGNASYFNSVNSWLNYTSGTTTTTSTSSSQSGGAYIEVSPTSINRTPNTGQIITINGYNFKPGEKGFVAMDGGLQLSPFVASSNGTFTIDSSNTESETAISPLWAAIQNVTSTTTYIVAYGYSGSGYSNKVTVTLY